MRPASSVLPGSPNGTNGSRGRKSAVSGSAVGSGISPASVSAIAAGRWACATAPMSGRAAWTARWIARSEDGASPDRDRAARASPAMARPRCRRDPARPCAGPIGVTSDVLLVEADREVALASRDEAASPEASAGGDDGHCSIRQLHRPACVGQASACPWHVPSRGVRDHRPTHCRRPRLPLARNRDFKVLLTSQGVSALGDAVTFTALPLLVLALTGSGLAMGIVGALQTLPDLVFGMVAGALADRTDRRRMMLLADLGRAVLTALIPLSVLLGGPTMVVILLVAAPMSVLRSLFLAGLHRLGAGPRRALADRPRELDLRGDLLARLHRRAGHRRLPVRGHRAGADAGHRRGLVRAVRLALAFVRRDLRAPIDRPTARYRRGHPRGHRVHRRPPAAPGDRSSSGASMSIILGAARHGAGGPRHPRPRATTDSILGLLLTAYGIGTVAGALLTARTDQAAAWRRS